MKQPEHTTENCEKLADVIVESLDLDSLMELARDSILAAMNDDKDVFLDNVETYGFYESYQN